jgi:hypothetical protein
MRLVRRRARRRIGRIGDAVFDIAANRHYASLAADEGAARRAELEIVDEAPRMVLRVARGRGGGSASAQRSPCRAIHPVSEHDGLSHLGEARARPHCALERIIPMSATLSARWTARLRRENRSGTGQRKKSPRKMARIDPHALLSAAADGAARVVHRTADEE